MLDFINFWSLFKENKRFLELYGIYVIASGGKIDLRGKLTYTAVTYTPMIYSDDVYSNDIYSNHVYSDNVYPNVLHTDNVNAYL